MTAIADRIDRLAAGGLLLVDYKTGAVPTKKEIAGRDRAAIAARRRDRATAASAASPATPGGARILAARRRRSGRREPAIDDGDPARADRARARPAAGADRPLRRSGDALSARCRCASGRRAFPTTAISSGSDRGRGRGMSAAAPSRAAHGARPRSSVWVSASAGTGKTKVLTERLLTLMLDGTDPVAHPVPDLHPRRRGRDGEPAQRPARRLDDDAVRRAGAGAGGADRTVSGRCAGRPRAPAVRARARHAGRRSRSRRSTPSASRCCGAFRSKPGCRRNSP